MHHQKNRILGRVLAISETDDATVMSHDQASTGDVTKGRTSPANDTYPPLDWFDP